MAVSLLQMGVTEAAPQKPAEHKKPPFHYYVMEVCYPNDEGCKTFTYHQQNEAEKKHIQEFGQWEATAGPNWRKEHPAHAKQIDELRAKHGAAAPAASG